MTRDWSEFFTPDDFVELINEEYSICDIAAERANAILRKAIEESVVVYGPQSFYGYTQTTQNSWHTFHNPGHTHTARLVDIKEIK